MDLGLALALILAVAFAVTNGLHDASNAIATLVATRGARPGTAVAMATVLNLLGPLLIGAAVAETIKGLIDVPAAEVTAVIGSALAAAVGWNLFTWRRGIPSSSGHALVGGLMGSALLVGGTSAVVWGGMDGLRPTGVMGVLLALAISPLLGALAAYLWIRLFGWLAQRATRRWLGPVRVAQWLSSGALAFSHGANDAQKSVGVMAALLGLSIGSTSPTSLTLICSVAITLGTALGGWPIIRTIGRGIYRIRAADGLASEMSSAGVIFGASLLGAPTSTTQVVASSVVGVGVGRGRVKHVRWAVVSEMSMAWLVTFPLTAGLAALVAVAWRALS